MRALVKIHLTSGEVVRVRGLDAEHSPLFAGRAEALAAAASPNAAIGIVHNALAYNQQIWDGSKWRWVNEDHVLSIECEPFD